MPITCTDERRNAAPFDFPELERLRLFSKQILRDQLTSLGHFKYSYGFKHLEDSTGVSVASSATCVLSLIATDSWKNYSIEAKTRALLKYLVKRDTSADLPKNNPFTLAWILEAVAVLDLAYPGCLDSDQRRRLATKESKLQNDIQR